MIRRMKDHPLSTQGAKGRRFSRAGNVVRSYGMLGRRPLAFSGMLPVSCTQSWLSGSLRSGAGGRHP